MKGVKLLGKTRNQCCACHIKCTLKKAKFWNAYTGVRFAHGGRLLKAVIFMCLGYDSFVECSWQTRSYFQVLPMKWNILNPLWIVLFDIFLCKNAKALQFVKFYINDPQCSVVDDMLEETSLLVDSMERQLAEMDEQLEKAPRTVEQVRGRIQMAVGIPGSRRKVWYWSSGTGEGIPVLESRFNFWNVYTGFGFNSARRET